jgi:hypothetical protein
LAVPAILAWRKTSPERSTPGQLLIEARLELDVGGGDLPGGAHELLVEAAEGGAAVAGDEAAGVQAGAPVALLLHQAGADERVIAGDQHVLLGQIVFVIETDGSQRHRCPLCRPAASQSLRRPCRNSYRLAGADAKQSHPKKS